MCKKAIAAQAEKKTILKARRKTKTSTKSEEKKTELWKLQRKEKWARAPDKNGFH